MGDPFTPEQIEALGTIIGTQVNNTFTARMGTIEKKLEGKLTAGFETFSKTLDEKLTALPKPSKDDEPGDKGSKGKDKDNSVELQTLRKQQSDQAKALEEIRAERDREREKNRSMALKSTVTDELSKVGITGHARLALNCLLQDGRIAFEDKVVDGGDADKLVFRGDDGAGWVDLAVGLKGWAKSADAKVFLPASGAGGAGTRPAVRTLEPGIKITDEERRHALGDALKNALG